MKLRNNQTPEGEKELDSINSNYSPKFVINFLGGKMTKKI